MIPFSTSATQTLDSRGGRCAYAQIDRLRREGPAVPVQLPEGMSAWSVSRGDVVKRLLTHPGVSRDLKKTVPSYEPGSVPWLSPWVDVESMATTDGAEHARLRKLITPAFTPRRVQAMRAQVEAAVAGLLDDMEKLPGDEPVDLHARFSYRVPTQMICDLFGVPDDQRPHVLRLLHAAGDTGASEEEDPDEEPIQLYDELNAAMRLLIDTKRQNPGDDLTSFLLAARADEEKALTEQELISTLLLMIGGGSQTTINLIDHTARELLAHPAQLATVLADPTRWTDAIEESLRLHCPVMHLPMRFAAEDIDLGEGVTIGQGDAILICYAGHGRDPEIHADPERFDIDRSTKEHVAFGLGPHFCPGKHLALLEAEVALPALFARFPRLELAVEPAGVESMDTFIGNNVVALPVFLRHR